METEKDLSTYGRYQEWIINWYDGELSYCNAIHTRVKTYSRQSANSNDCTEASAEDIAWIEECIKQDRFVPQEELTSLKEQYTLY